MTLADSNIATSLKKRGLTAGVASYQYVPVSVCIYLLSKIPCGSQTYGLAGEVVTRHSGIEGDSIFHHMRVILGEPAPHLAGIMHPGKTPGQMLLLFRSRGTPFSLLYGHVVSLPSKLVSPLLISSRESD